ncbi:MAG: RNase adaptor protein RapZ, partial [Actinobacteria bacterium]|nr:RNase adaptor protein RapZ [Actinomycetota bacterium]
PHTGRDASVRDYVLAQDGAGEFLDRYEGLLRLVFDGYAREGKRYALSAVGCTGGKHRSVAIGAEIAAYLAELGFPSTVIHRDLDKE